MASRRGRATGGQAGPPASSGTRAARGQPVSLPSGTARRQASPWGCGEGTREEANAILSGGGEGLSLWQPHPTRQRADFPGGSGVTRAIGAPMQETTQMTAVATPAGAVSRNAVDWHALHGQKAHTIVRRLQARIVKATQAGLTVVKPRPQRGVGKA